MACDVNIVFDERHQKTFKNLVNLSDSPILEIALALLNDTLSTKALNEKLPNDKKKLSKAELIVSIFNNLYTGKASNKLIGNISYSELTKKIPILGGWPTEEALQNVKGFDINKYNIIYVDKTSSEIPKLYKVDVGEDKKIEVIKVYRNQIYNYRNWLLSNIIINKITSDTKFSAEFNAIKDELKLDAKEILRKYLDGEYSKTPPIKFGSRLLDVESILLSELLELLDKTQKRKYNSEFFNALVSRFSTEGSNKLLKYVITPALFKKLASQLIENEELLKEVDALENDRDKISTIFNAILKEDPEFPFRISSITKSKLKFNRVFLSINERYGLTFKLAKELFNFVEDYRGFDIYTYNGKYYYSNEPITENSSLEPYVSKKDVIRKIDEKIKDLTLDSANIALKTSKDGLFYVNGTSRGYKQGLIIKSLNIEVDYKNIELTDREKKLIFELGLDEFYRYVKYSSEFTLQIKDRILNEIDTPEKAAIFIYKARQNKTTLLLTNNDILDLIKSAGYKYFYVADTTNPYNIRVKEIKKEQIDNIRDVDPKFSGQDITKAELITEFANAISLRLEGTGFTVELLTLSEIASDNRFAGVLATAKAFIKGNSIIINTTIADIGDPIHEYAHVFLGLIKAQDFNKYQRLIDNVLSRESPNKLASIRRSKFNSEYYSNLSETDLNEELFAELFTQHILNNKSKDFVNYLNVRSIVGDKAKTIWDMLDSDSKVVKLGDIWNEPLAYLANINSDMIVGLQLEDSSLGRFLTYRQASNWIALKIKDKEIIEKCW